ncbi:IclR family transcriptional regulator domain-containing protein [Gordonia phthalatica]|uniref:IclR family transcriptional regulator n=1 Tax=Gordonia phthalatica TaxID=1136941 RepID=A0A0N9NJH5_9ACTN|nr:IclR family transcriptional regulator C-terminal domain-containing protein [Gordonia phthalatica]ALG86118.1 hypothetical protein ACH46_18480 [Gordonia phthalatica]
MSDSADVVTSLARGIAVLRSLSVTDGPLTLAEVATRCNTTRATARRLLLTLEHLGYVASDGPTFWLRPRVMELGDAYLAGLGLPDLAHAHLERLADRVHDTTSLTVLDDDDIVYVDRVKASRVMTVNITVGTRFPAYIMSSGRVLLADLPVPELSRRVDAFPDEDLREHHSTRAEIQSAIDHARTDGFAITDKELDPALRSIAAPVRDSSGRAVAAVNVATSATRTSVDQLRMEILPELLTTTAAISAALAGTATPA